MNDKKRKLRAILFADIVGYTALMQKDETNARVLLQKFRNTLAEKVKQYDGEIINNYGDGCLCTFESAVDAMTCAKEVQLIFQKEPVVPVRIGLHSGDVFFEADNVFGDSVNIASRIESLGVAGAVLFSKRIKRHIANQTEFKVQSLGEFDFKNVEKTMAVFGLANEGLVIPKREELKGKGQLIKQKETSNLTYIGLGALAISLMGLLYFFSTKNTLQAPTKDLHAITIFPFDVKGSSDIQYLGEGIVDLVSTKLDDIPNINPIDPNRIFNELKKEQVTTPTLEQAMSLSKSFGANQFILGSITEINDRLQVTASKYDVNGQRIAKKSLEGKKSNLAASIDELTKILVAQELTQEGQEFNSLAAMTSDNLTALTTYLKGEQAFRKANFTEAYTAFKQAVQIDSTFAMAWIRLREASGWGSEKVPDALLYAQRYKDKLPIKWQDYLNAYLLYEIGSPETEIVLTNLIQKYGETREFTNRLGEYYFHFNPVHGRSSIEAKAWLEKTLALDPNNKEALSHLVAIAYLEQNDSYIEQVLAQTEESALPWLSAKILLNSKKDSLSLKEIQSITNHPDFAGWIINPLMAARDNVLAEYINGAQYFPYFKEKNFRFNNLSLKYGLQGKEKAAYAAIKNQKYDFVGANKPHSHHPTLLATLIASSNYLPLAHEYENLYKATQSKNSPLDLFAAAKYCMVLNKKSDCQTFKNKLNALRGKENGLFKPATYYWHSLRAFEIYNQGNHDLALAAIDSAFQHSPDFWEGQVYCMDKIFMLASIYEEKGEYEKSIAHFENIPVVDAFAFSKGYATYRLSRLYELNGDSQKAIAKCNLLIDNYKDCDKKYQPWVEEVKERRERLIAAIN